MISGSDLFAVVRVGSSVSSGRVFRVFLVLFILGYFFYQGFGICIVGILSAFSGCFGSATWLELFLLLFCEGFEGLTGFYPSN